MSPYDSIASSPRPHRRLRALAPLLALLGILGAHPAAPQDARPGVFGEVLDVRVVNVEVVVTDKQGARVYNLTREDFTLEVDGQPVPIDFFSEVVGGRVNDLGGEGSAAPPAAEPGRPLGVSWLVFIDDFFSVKRDRDQVLRGVGEQLGHLGPADRMAMVAWDGKRLTMLTSWTGSVTDLKRALVAAERRPSFGLQRLTEQRSLLGELGPGRIEGVPRFTSDPHSLDPDERQLVELLASQVKRSLGAASATMRAFAAPPGRKAMLLLSGGWPWRPVEFVASDPGRMITEPTPGAEPLYSPLADVANLLGYTLYTVDVPGLSQRVIDISAPGPVGSGARMSDVRREQDQHLSLDWLATSTGGRSFLNDRRLSVFEETVTDTRSFYWLGFTPKRSGDDKPHKVQVKVNKPGLEVRSREGFLDASRTAEVSMAVESSLLFGNPASTAPLQLSLGKPEKAGGRTMRVPLRMAMPLDGLTPLPGAAGPTVALELRVVAQDEQGAISAMPVIPLQLRVPDQLKPGDVGRYETALMMRRAIHDLVVAVYDPVSGKIFSATARVAP